MGRRILLILFGYCRMFRPSFATLLSLFCFFSLASSGFFVTDARAQEASFVKFDPPLTLPSMLVHDVDGRETTLSAAIQSLPAADFILLHLWSPSCGLCTNEMRTLDQVRKGLAGQNMPVLSLAQDPRGQFSVPAFIRRQAIGKDSIFIDSSLRALNYLKPAGVPSTYIVSRAGQVMAVHEGTMSW